MNTSHYHEKWPLTEFDEHNQPHFLFIITPPYSGSTALATLINTSSKTMVLQERAEGQWLIPGLCEKDRWNPEKQVNYDSIKSVWLSTFQQNQRLTRDIKVVIEKSPPNMMRIEKISSVFLDYSFIANNRNPFANCASILYRQHNAKSLSYEERINILSGLLKSWLSRSVIIKELVTKMNIPLITYEAFCKKPSSILEILKLPSGVSKTINTNAKVTIKDYSPQVISNQNSRQISNLSIKEIEFLRNTLKGKDELLNFFGYTNTPNNFHM